MEVGSEDVVGAELALDAHRRGDVGDAEQAAQVGDREDQHAEHAVGAVDEGQPLLLAQLDGRDARSGEGLRRRHVLALRVADDTLPHEGQGAVRERREVARAAQRTVLVHHGRDAGVEHGDVGPERLLADTRAPRRQRGDAQEHERTDHLTLDLGARAGGVRANQRALQLCPQLDGDVARRQRPEAGGDAIVRLGVVGECLDDGPRPAHLGERLVADGHSGVVAGDGDDVVERHRADADGDGCGRRAEGAGGAGRAGGHAHHCSARRAP